MSKIIKIKSFDKYQHYKGGHMVWLKLYVKLLHDVKFMSLNESERWVFIGLMLLACSSENSIDYNPSFLEKILNTSKIGKSLTTLKSINFIEILYKKSKQIHIDNINKIREDKRREEVREQIKSSLSRKD